MGQSPLLPPGKLAQARFKPGFGTRSLLTVDTEEEFDWTKPFEATGHTLGHVPRLAKFQQFCEGLGVVPVYLIDWPVANDADAAAILRPAIAAGTAELGVQLHPWVNPPFEEEISERNSFAGNLPPALERAKFSQLIATIRENFQTDPQIYRAGRYGLGPSSAAMLRDHGIGIDTSVRSKFDYSDIAGPDYRGHPLTPYWLGEAGGILELPLTTVFWGMLRKQGDTLYPLLAKHPRLRAALARTGVLERISLTPEGVTSAEAIRAIDMAVDDGLPLLVLSFHSPSLEPGHTPYVRTEADLDRMYDWWRTVYAYLRKMGVRPVTITEILRSVET